jgi:NADPH2:quinone reductase
MVLLPRYVGAIGFRSSGRRHRFHGIAIFGLYIAGGWVLPGRKQVVPTVSMA